MKTVIDFFESVGFDIVFKKENIFRALYSSKGTSIYAEYRDSVLGIWYEHHNVKKQILDDSFIESGEDLKLILSKNVYLRRELPYLMRQIEEYNCSRSEECSSEV